MKTKDFYHELQKKIISRPDVVLRKYILTYQKGDYEFWRVASDPIRPADNIIFITAGFHGDETAGPLTILYYFDEIIDYIHQRGLKAIIYPLANPSGFDVGLRYNIDDDEGQAGNNVFMLYEMPDGRLADDLKNSTSFKAWHSPLAEDLDIGLPAETKLMHRILREEPIGQVRAAVDLHQDFITAGLPPMAYQYGFADLEKYQPIVKQIEKLLPILKNTPIGAGYKLTKIETGEAAGQVKDEDAVICDDNGFIVRHDSSISDFFYRSGVEPAITVETSGATPFDTVCQVNLIWIKGLADMMK